MLKKSGAVLPLVLGIVLVVTCMFTALMSVPGSLRTVEYRLERKQQAIYDAESSILAYENGLPEGYFERSPWNWKLPPVMHQTSGNWLDVSASARTVDEDFGRVHALSGRTVRNFNAWALSEGNQFARNFRENLKNEIQAAEEFQVKSGTRRFLGEAQSMSIQVNEGDLYLDLKGHVEYANLMSDGNLVLKGSAQFDTLRMYSEGALQILGSVSAGYLLAYSGAQVELHGSIAPMEMVVARQGIVYRSRHPQNLCEYPDVPTNDLNRYSFAVRPCLLPHYVDGQLKHFRWSLE
ncbi:MAG: hypothetical protein HUK20_05770 [Fibrobacter sp.]|nr:hypothetical protein [Fibrobacter sp.]